MPDILASIFELENARGFFVPKFDIHYVEEDTELQWYINCGGSRAYFIRIGEDLGDDFNAQSADSHFMVNRIVTALFLAGFGLFRAKAKGRLFFEDIVTEEFRFQSHLDLWDAIDQNDVAAESIDQLRDWYGFICQNNLFRRAAEDAYAALLNPVEAVLFVYRGMEWLLRAANIGWRELAEDIGISFNDIKKFKKFANVDYGQRHGIETGVKLRAVTPEYGALVADFIYGFCNARKRVDESYSGISPEEASEIVMKAMPLVPYP